MRYRSTVILFVLLFIAAVLCVSCDSGKAKLSGGDGDPDSADGELELEALSDADIDAETDSESLADAEADDGIISGDGDSDALDDSEPDNDPDSSGADDDSDAFSDSDAEWAACEQECVYCTEQMPDCSCVHDNQYECSDKLLCAPGYKCSPEQNCNCAPDITPDGDVADCAPQVFDMELIRNSADLNCSFSNQRTAMKDGVLLYVWDVSYVSYESIGCELRPIVIRGYAARPLALTSSVPAVLHAHGLGGCAKADNATGPAALLNMLVLAYTGPGGGGSSAPECAVSEGLPSSYAKGYRMFDTIPDPRGSWFWAHAVAAMRGLSCLETRPETDASRMGMTGFSAGGVVTLISAAVDSRVKAAVSLSSSGAWDVATQSPDAWQHNLLKLAGLDTASPQWAALSENVVPDVLLPATTAKILMANGSTDEFFPLTAHMATYKQIPGDNKRLAIAANFDHGCYSLTGVENAENIEARAEKASSGNQRAWLRHQFGTDADYQYYPLTPQLTVNSVAGGIYAVAAVDGGGSKLDIERVKFWLSNDNAFVFGSVEMEYNSGLGAWTAAVAAPLQDNSVYFVEVEYKTKALVLPERFIISSEPHIPDGFVPHIRGMDDCL